MSTASKRTDLLGMLPESRILSDQNARIRVLYSFGMKLGGARIGLTAWQQVNGLLAAGADVLVYPGVLLWPLPGKVKTRPTLARGPFRISYKLLGRLRSYALHDYVVSRRLEALAGKIDIIHVWPLCSLRTIRVANQLGIPVVYERPNPHTGFFYERVQRECEQLGISLPPGHEHGHDAAVIRLEEQEYQESFRLLCPSEFVSKTFLDRGFAPEKLMAHQYGYDETVFYPATQRKKHNGLRVLFAGTVSPVKGLHYALEAWLSSPARETGTFLIAGGVTANYAQKLEPMLKHPSIQMLGQRRDIPELMRDSDVLILPSIAEGYPLVIAEARGSGCVPLVSDACCSICEHMENSLVHRVGDVGALTKHIAMLHEDRALLERLRASSLSTVNRITWKAAGIRLLEVYRETIESWKATAPKSRDAGKLPV